MKKTIAYKFIYLFALLLLGASCIEEKNLYQNGDDDDNGGNEPGFVYTPYQYSFNDEIENAVAEIVIQTHNEIDATEIISEIPYLKYNKSWLLMLTQDDCKHAAYCRTWASINGRPVSSSELYPTTPDPHELYYDAAQLQAGDLPPTIIPARGTLGSTDGTGNEVRFSITTTLAPEYDWMKAETHVNKGFTDNYYRFYMKSGLVWNNVQEMLNFGTGIAFHDVKAEDVNNPVQILEHYNIAQNIILEELNGRGCKMLAEPNGNKEYVTAALQYPEIQTMVAQNGTVRLYPFDVNNDLTGVLLHREFNSPEFVIEKVKAELQKDKTLREAIHIGAHGTDNSWIEFLQWINDNYGKDGDDSVWFPSQEEYFEYNYYRMHGNIKVEQIDRNTIKLTIELPSGKYFYYPSVSVNLTGINKESIVSITSNKTVTGFSYGDYQDGLTMNIDCRKHLYAHALHYAEQYKMNTTEEFLKNDALYFGNMLKESREKDLLLEQIKLIR